MNKSKLSKSQRKKLRRNRRKRAGEDVSGKNNTRRMLLTEDCTFSTNKEWSTFAEASNWRDDSYIDYLTPLEYVDSRVTDPPETDAFVEWHKKVIDLHVEIGNIMRQIAWREERGLPSQSDASETKWYHFGLLRTIAKPTTYVTKMTKSVMNETTAPVDDTLLDEDEESLITITSVVDDDISFIDMSPKRVGPPALEQSWESLSSEEGTNYLEDDSSSFGEITEVESVISLLSFSLSYDVSYAQALTMGISKPPR